MTLKQAIMTRLRIFIDHENKGLHSVCKSSFEVLEILYDNHISFDLKNNMVLRNKIPLYKITRRYSSRKTNGQYKQLKLDK